MLIKNCSYVVTQNKERRILRDVDILIEDSVIKQIGPDLRGSPILDGTNKVFLPGLINTHTHIGMHLLRGICDDEELDTWLEKVTNAEAKLSFEEIKHSAQIAIQEMLTSGTTTFAEMYWPINPIIEAVRESLIRAVLIPTYAQTLPHIQTNTERDFTNIQEICKNIPRITLGIGCHSVYSCSKEFITELKTIAKNNQILFAIHIAETRKERVECLEKHKFLPIEFLESLNILDAKTLLIHAIWITKSEIRTLAKHAAMISHNPISNLKLASGGVMPLPEMLEAGIVVGLGTDSVASNNSMDLFEEMKITGLIHKHHRWDPKTAPVQTILDMATINGARCLGLDHEIGSIEVGKKADIISIRLDKPQMQPLNNILSNIVYAINGGMITDVIVDGTLAIQKSY
mgnify:CR=1 FL=1